jgi:hypothetical protein
VCVCVCVLSLLCAATRVRSRAHVAGRSGCTGLHHGVTLLVVAHPDDESMCAAGPSALSLPRLLFEEQPT